MANLSLLGNQWHRKTKDKRYRSELTSGQKLQRLLVERDGKLFIPGVLEALHTYQKRSQQASAAAKKRWGNAYDAIRTSIHVEAVHSGRTAQPIELSIPDSEESHKDFCVGNLEGIPIRAETDLSFDYRTAFAQLLEQYPHAGRERLARGFEAFVAVLDAEASDRTCSRDQIFVEIYAGLERWKPSARWQRNMVHTVHNFLIERLWKEHPFVSVEGDQNSRNKPSYATARANGDVNSLDEYEQRYGK